MMQIQDLFQALGIQPQLRTDVDAAELVRYAYRNSYCVNEAGKLTALNLCGLDLAFTYEQAKAFLEFEWVELISLNLSENRFAMLRIPAMPKLRFLNMSELQGALELSFSVALPALEELDVNESDIPALILPAGFDALRYLDVSRNEMRTLELQGAFPALSDLDASGNSLKEIEFSTPLAALQHVYLGKNVIENWDWVKPFPQLETLHLSENRLKKLPAHDVKTFKKIFPKLTSLSLSENNFQSDIQSFSEEKHCLVETLAYLKDLAHGSVPDNECKVLVIGNGNVGKSTLVHRIVKNKYIKDRPSTHGIVLEQYEGEMIHPWKLNFWDFGGQDIYHATHRLFMQQDAVYLLLWDAETEKLDFDPRESGSKYKYKNYRIPYWLAYAKSLGKGSPIILVQTKCSQKSARQYLSHIREAFPDIELHHVDSAKDDWKKNGVNKLLEDVVNAIETIKPENPDDREMVKTWADIRQAIRDKQQKGTKSISVTEFRELVKPFQVQIPDMVLTWLSQTGVLFYQKGLFNNKVILDQAWAIEAVYTLFNREKNNYYKIRYEHKGKLTGKELATFWPGYSRQEVSMFTNFMVTCQLCFEDKKEEQERWISFEDKLFIFPQMLSEDAPSLIDRLKKDWKKNSALYFTYRHAFMHYGVMQSFIIRAQHLAKVEDIWKNGIVLNEVDQSIEHTALIEFMEIEENDSVRMELHVIVNTKGKVLLDKIRNTIEDLQNSPGTESVSVDGVNFVSLVDLKAHKPEINHIRCENGEYVEYAAFKPFLQKDSTAKIDPPEPQKHLHPMSNMQQVPARKHIKSLIAANDLNQALNLISQVNPLLENDTIHQLSRLNGLKQQEDKGITDSRDTERTRNQIRQAIYSLVEEIPEGAVVEVDIPSFIGVLHPGEGGINPFIVPGPPKVYFSYAWGDEQEEAGESRQEIVDRMYEALEKDGIEVGRDIKMEYGDQIDKFMDKLSSAKLILVFMSDKYLTSTFCMGELCDIFRKSKQDPNIFSKKILPIRVEDINFHDLETLTGYLDYWNKKFKKHKKAINKFPELGQPHLDELEKIRLIKNDIGKVMGYFRNLNAKTNPLLIENNFEQVKSMILKRLGR